MEETPGIRIERIAAAKNLATGAKLAAALGVTYETLRKWREGLTAPNRKKQAAIAEYLGVKPAVFMHGTADEAGWQMPAPPAEPKPSAARVLEDLGALLTAVPAHVGDAVAENLAGFARERGAEHRKLALITLLGPLGSPAVLGRVQDAPSRLTERLIGTVAPPPALPAFPSKPVPPIDQPPPPAPTPRPTSTRSAAKPKGRARAERK